MGIIDRLRKRKRQEQVSFSQRVSPADLIELWRKIISGDRESWVLFRQGTCVVFAEPVPNLHAQALDLMREWGPVHVGTPSADFNVLSSDESEGWVVTSNHPDILTFVSPHEVTKANRGDLFIGLRGRTKRDRDATELEVIHIEDKRDAV